MSQEQGKLFEILLLSDCLIPGKNSFKESKALVNVTPTDDETIILFNIDDQSNPQCKLRQFLWGKQTGQKMCDLIVFYAKGVDRIICFVELKDNIDDLGTATEQVINTYSQLKTHLGSKYTAKAFISAPKGSPPKEHQEYQLKLSKAFGQSNFEHNGAGDSLGDFLRGIVSKSKGKRKK
jgi:hypothetical protein